MPNTERNQGILRRSHYGKPRGLPSLFLYTAKFQGGKNLPEQWTIYWVVASGETKAGSEYKNKRKDAEMNARYDTYCFQPYTKTRLGEGLVYPVVIWQNNAEIQSDSEGRRFLKG